MTAGLATFLIVLIIALAAGLAWRVRNGRMHGPGRGNAARQADPAAASAPSPAAGPALTSAQLGQPLGDRATLVQFSSAFCSTCRATRRILSEVAGTIDGVAHIEIDAESRLDLVRELNVLRTPTVLVLAPDGRIARRASGQPRKPDVIAAVSTVVDAARNTAPSHQG